MTSETDNNDADLAQDVSAADAQTIAKIHKYTGAAMVVGIVPIPLVDLIAVTALQLKMLHSLSKNYDIPFKSNIGKSAIGSLVGGYVPYASSVSLAASVGKIIPGIGHVSSGATLVLLNGASTYAIGKVFAQHFASGGTFLTFDPEQVREYFAEQYEKGKGIVSSMRSSKTDEATANTATSKTASAS
ncbi:MAG: DUF697 domain-containing protein [Mariprofundales bacterium]